MPGGSPTLRDEPIPRALPTRSKLQWRAFCRAGSSTGGAYGGAAEPSEMGSGAGAAQPGMGLVDVTVVGCGPAGVALAAELGKQGLQVGPQTAP